MNSRQRRKLEAKAFNEFKVLREKAHSETNVKELPLDLLRQFIHRWDVKNWRELMKSNHAYK